MTLYILAYGDSYDRSNIAVCSSLDEARTLARAHSERVEYDTDYDFYSAHPYTLGELHEDTLPADYGITISLD